VPELIRGEAVLTLLTGLDVASLQRATWYIRVLYYNQVRL